MGGAGRFASLRQRDAQSFHHAQWFIGNMRVRDRQARAPPTGLRR